MILMIGLDISTSQTHIVSTTTSFIDEDVNEYVSLVPATVYHVFLTVSVM